MSFYEHFDTEMTGIGYRWSRNTARFHIQQIKKWHPDAVDLYEVGPGAGVFAQEWTRQGGRYTALEGSPKLAEQLRAAGLTIVEGLAPPLPAESGSADVVYAAHVLEHMHHAGLAIAFVNEMRRVLRPGGLVCLKVPDMLAQGKYFWAVDYTHSYPTTTRRVEQLLHNGGFNVCQRLIMSGSHSGIFAVLLAWVARLIPFRPLVSTVLPLTNLRQRLLSGKLTFMRQLLFIAQKEVPHL